MKKIFFISIIMTLAFSFSKADKPMENIGAKRDAALDRIDTTFDMRFFGYHDNYSSELYIDTSQKGYFRFQMEIINKSLNDTIRFEGLAYNKILYNNLEDSVDLEFYHGDFCGPAYLHFDYDCIIDSCNILFAIDLYNSRIGIIDPERCLLRKYPNFNFRNIGVLRRYP